jgi:hypothetical protein
MSRSLDRPGVVTQITCPAVTTKTGLISIDIEGDPEWVSDYNSVDTTGNDLYWFWDFVWSAPQLCVATQRLFP